MTFKPYPKPAPKEKKEKPKQYDLFLKMYNNGFNFVSFLTGRQVKERPGSLLFVNCFAHVLPKGSYTHYKMNPENIVILSPEEHHLFDFGSEEQRQKYAEVNKCDWSGLYELRDRLKEKYPK